MLVFAYFENEGLPLEALSPTCTIIDADTGQAAVLAASMTNVGAGFYRYDFTSQNRLKNYVVTCDGGVSVPAERRYATNVIGADDAGIGIDAIKAKTDGLPSSTTARLDQVDAAIAEIPDTASMGALLDGIEAEIRGGSETLESIAANITATAANVGAILAAQVGTWEIVGTQMIFKAPGTNVEIARFNLYDAEGTPSASSVYKRVRI